jgi:hypothetical protein
VVRVRWELAFVNSPTRLKLRGVARASYENSLKNRHRLEMEKINNCLVSQKVMFAVNVIRIKSVKWLGALS